MIKRRLDSFIVFHAKMSTSKDQLTAVSSTTCTRVPQDPEEYDHYAPTMQQTYFDIPTQDNSISPIPYDAIHVKSNDRESRNKAEKMRRTKLNTYINDMQMILPIIVNSGRKVDKTGVLRIAANDLRKEHVFGNSYKVCHMDVKPALVDTFLDLVGGFMVTLTCKGLITVVSSNIQNYLGHCKIDLLGQNIYKLTHPDDVHVLERHIYPPELQACHSATSPDASAVFEQKHDFFIRLMRACPRTEQPQYEVCRIDGALRRADKAAVNGMREEQIIRRQRVRRDRTISSSGNDVVFIGMVRVIMQATITNKFLKASYQEYWTRHLIDGRIVQCDQRISIVAGYMAEEITGVSAFTFMHKEDVRWVIIALRQMYDQSKKIGESCYRLMSRTGQFIYLKTRGFLEIDKTTKAVQSFICLNSIVSQSEGLKLIDDMKRKYSAIVNINELDETGKMPLEEAESQPIEDPHQLEQVIMHLVTNLPTTNGPENGSGVDIQEITEPSEEACSSRSPALSADSLMIIPPEPVAIRFAIAKSVSVIAQARGMKMTADSPGPVGSPSNKKRTLSESGCDSDIDSWKRTKDM